VRCRSCGGPTALRTRPFLNTLRFVRERSENTLAAYGYDLAIFLDFCSRARAGDPGAGEGQARRAVYGAAAARAALGQDDRPAAPGVPAGVLALPRARGGGAIAGRPRRAGRPLSCC
jgi:hypothetical protein